MKAAVVGGSLAGLMTGIECSVAGVDVEIHERSAGMLDDRGAGIVMQPETLQMLTQRCGLEEEETGVWLNYRQYLGPEGEPATRQRMPQLMTSWGLLYRALRSAFPAGRYYEGSPFTEFTCAESAVFARFGAGDPQRFDLLVGADGARSFVRQQMLSEVKPRYAGYVAWRGVVPESEADHALLHTFDDHFTFQQMYHSHILCYVIPGAAGEREHGKRRLNWVWYWNVPESELSPLMTGRDGRLRDFSVPPGQVSAQFLAQQNDVAHELLAPPFRVLWQATREPFLQPIVDLAVPRMVFDRTLLVGDAAFVPRPHTAASTSKAAANAIALGEAVRASSGDLDRALGKWESAQLTLGSQLEAQGRMLGNRSQFS
jgi:2-polyprenyl-6-methoxyphenol hydroxylase-like FAD-dependent oxidoreductase